MNKILLLALITTLLFSCSDEYDNKERFVKPYNIVAEWQCQNKEGNIGIYVKFFDETRGYTHSFRDGYPYKRFSFNYTISKDTMTMIILDSMDEPSEFYIKREIYMKNSKLYFGGNIYRRIKSNVK